jgi:cation diffusion facilitator CzcD-associated flavoprotein CzcO
MLTVGAHSRPLSAPGCKRMILNPGYLECLHQPNMDMNWEGIERFTETGLVTKKGQAYIFDALIFGTGFSIVSCEQYFIVGDVIKVNGTLQMSTALRIIGSNGMVLADMWRTVAPTAYLGTTVPGYPNFFMLLGMKL